MKSKNLIFLFIFSLFFFGNILFASYAEFGSEVFIDKDGNKEMYNKIALYPEFSFWKISLGLDLQIYLDQDGNIREEDWDSWDDVLNKVWYIRYGQKGEPVFINLGGISSASIGHGTIFSRYSNMIRYPEVKKVGLIFDINCDSWGMETLVSNLQEKEVYGARLHYKPLASSDLFLLSDLTFAISAGTDLDPDDDSNTKDDDVSVVAVDVELPVLKTSVISSTLFTDLAQMSLGDRYIETHTYSISTNTYSEKSKNNGKGFITGVLGKLLFFDYKVAYKKLDNNFIDGFFNSFYDVERYYKANLIENTDSPKREIYSGELTYSYRDFLSIYVSYDYMKYDLYNSYPLLHGELKLDKSLFLDKFELFMSLDKKNFRDWKTFKDFDTPNTLLKFEVGYAIAPNAMLYLIKEENFDANGEQTTRTKIDLRLIF
jgi:hypothetical protein